MWTDLFGSLYIHVDSIEDGISSLRERDMANHFDEMFSVSGVTDLRNSTSRWPNILCHVTGQYISRKLMRHGDPIDIISDSMRASGGESPSQRESIGQRLYRK